MPTGARYGGLSASSAVPARARLVWVERLRLPLMIGVVLIHAYDPVRATHGELISLQGRAGFSDFVMFLLSQVIGRLSVPMFFAMSGFFEDFIIESDHLIAANDEGIGVLRSQRFGFGHRKVRNSLCNRGIVVFVG